MRNILAVFVGVFISVFAVNSAPVNGFSQHCPTGGTKVEAVGRGSNSLVITAGTEICVKAGTKTTGKVVADGIHDLSYYLESAGILGGNGEARDVSYYVIYPTIVTPTPTPTVNPTPTPVPTGSPVPTPEITLPPTDTK